ncbi:MAG: hypothetical protein AB9866_13960 [Syntrophobacteraceae bacterium]
MHRKALFVFIALSILLAPIAQTRAASEGAMKLRGQNRLSEFTPAEQFLNGNFVADEVDPHFVFGKVNEFKQSRSCPSTWLIEEGERSRIKDQKNTTGPIEYTLYLEEDCSGKVAYYIFVDRSQTKSAQWMEWRKQFHKSKAEPQYSAVSNCLEQAAQGGCPVDAELRFVEVGGDLILKKTEQFLTEDLKIKPIYDLKENKPIGK